MAKHIRPYINTNCGADHYADKNIEKIFEFSFPDGSGGLIQLVTINGENRVVIYNYDSSVVVIDSQDKTR
jgi:hypothetical protein